MSYEKPRLDEKTVNSLELLLQGLTPAEYLNTPKELGVRYLTGLVAKWRSPEEVLRRRRNVQAALASRDAKKEK